MEQPLLTWAGMKPLLIVITVNALVGLVPIVAAASPNAHQDAPQNAPTAPQNAPTAPQNAPQIPPAAAPSPPFPNRANEILPGWLRLRGEFRERFEGFRNAGFSGERDDLYWLSRFRLNATVTPRRRWSFQVQAQDARVADKTIGAVGVPFKASLDLRMAFTNVGDDTSPVAIRVGRQELAFGEQRLVGHVSWLNAARTFDGAKVTIRTRAFSVDAFGASVVQIMDGFDTSGNGNRFAGAYAATTKLIPRGSLEPYLLWRRDVNLPTETATFGDLAQTTLGVRLAGRMPGRLDYGVEMAMQRGSLGMDAVEAWAGHWQLRESLPGAFAARLTGEYNFASGDESPADGIRGTFDQLYPTPHDKYGLADQIAWKNIHHVRGGVEFTPMKGLPVTTNYHAWWVAETRDAVYAAGSAPLARVIGEAASRHVGQEIDIQATYGLTPQLQLAAGYAHIFPGAFLERATPGASYSHPYVMATYVFLAER